MIPGTLGRTADVAEWVPSFPLYGSCVLRGYPVDLDSVSFIWPLSPEDDGGVYLIANEFRQKSRYEIVLQVRFAVCGTSVKRRSPLRLEPGVVC